MKSAIPSARDDRRRALRLAYWNAGLWALGNGLTSSTLVVFLALELGAGGLAISLMLAAPRLVGILRLATPALLKRAGNRRRFCVGFYTLAALLLAMIAGLAKPGVLSSPRGTLWTLVAVWAGCHLFQYCATIVLWAWLRDLAPLRIRGRFLGRRERFLLLGQVVGMVAAGLFVYQVERSMFDLPRWVGYAVPTVLGAAMMLLAVLPLARMPEGEEPYDAAQAVWPAVQAVFVDRRFWRLLLFGIWFSLVNGLTQAAQAIFPRDVLGLSVLWLLVARSAMGLGQSGCGPWAGKAVDWLGSRPVLIVAQTIVATGPLFYWQASPEQPVWLAGAFVVWIAYAAINVALPALILKLAPDDDATPHLAGYYAVTGVVYAAGTIAGGWLLERLLSSGDPIEHYNGLFLAAWLARLASVLLLMRIIEPGARRLFSKRPSALSGRANQT